MLDKTRKDRDYLWGRIFGELSMWMDRAGKLTSIQRDVFIRDWQLRPLTTFTGWMERYQMTVIEAGAPRGSEDKRIGEIMWQATPEMLSDDSRLGPDCYLAYYQERGEYRTIQQEAMAEIGRKTSPRKAAASRANGAKGGRPKKNA